MGDTLKTQPKEHQDGTPEPLDRHYDAPEKDYREWLADVLGELNLKPTASPRGEGGSGTTKSTGRTAPAGKGVKGGWVGKRLRDTLFGDPVKRTAVKEDVRARIDDQVAVGKAKPVEITGSGGNQLRGNFFSQEDHNLIQNGGKPDTTKPVVLFLSGSGGSAEDYGTDIAEFYQKSGASMLSVNYAGYGEYAKGTEIPEPTEESILQDAQAMLQHLLDQGYKSDQIVIHGYSLGGAIAGKLQTHNEAPDGDEKPGAFRGLVLDRPMLSSTAGVKGNVDNKAKALIGAAITRKLVGSMSARKAIAASSSKTPIVLTTEEETKKVEGKEGETTPNTFSITARKLRDQMSEKKDRPVTGLTGAGDHENHANMLSTNGDLLKALLAGGQDASAEIGEGGLKPSDAKKQRDLVTQEIDKHDAALSRLFSQAMNLANKAKRHDGESDAAKASLQKLADEASAAMDALCELREALGERTEPVLQRAVAKAIERGIKIIGAASNSTKEAGVVMPVPEATRDTLFDRMAGQVVALKEFVDSFNEMKEDRGFGSHVARTKKQMNDTMDRVNDLGMVSFAWAGDRAAEVTEFRKARTAASLAIALYESPPPAPRKPSGLRGVLARVKRPDRTAGTGART